MIQEASRMRGREAPTEEGKSPVSEGGVNQVRIRSTARHEESRRNKGGPPSKAKYYLITDRGEVP